MNKDKLTDRRDNNIENKKEDYKDSNGSPEDFIEDMTDPEATDLFKEAFYAEGKALEEEALRSPFVEDEEKKEALRLRILAAAGRSTAENTVLEHKAALENQSNDTAKTSVEDVKKKKKRRFTPFMRWAAVLALVCVGVFGVSVTGQAKGSGLWSSIQRLIGGETRWEQDNNGEDRTYTSTEEEKAIKKIEEELDIEMPIFFYWPNKLSFQDVYIFGESSKFIMTYSSGEIVLYFEGWKGNNDSSENSVWQGEEEFSCVEYDGTNYTITKLKNDVYGECYYAKWNVGENIFTLSGITNREELEKILKNLKN